MSRRNASEGGESLDMAFEERFLRLRRVDPMDSLTRVGEPVDEHMTLGLYTVQHDPHLAEVHLRLSTRSVLLRNKDLDSTASLDVDLRATNPDIVTHGLIRQILRTMLIEEPEEDPTGSMALLSRSRRVLNQHRIDRSLKRF